MVQIWPSASEFSEGSDPIGSFVRPDVWRCILPPTFSYDAGAGYRFVVEHAVGTMYDGHRQFAPNPNQRTSKNATPIKAVAGFPDGELVWQIERYTNLTECEVRGEPSFELIGGTPGGNTLKGFGICACVTVGSTAFEGGDFSQEYGQTVNGYFFIETKDSRDTGLIALVTVTAGVAFVNAVQPLSFVDPTQANTPATPSQFWPPRPLRMNIENVAGDAVISCYRTALNGTEAQCFGQSINAGTFLSAGRSGFGVQTFRAADGSNTVGKTNTFEVRPQDGSDIFFREEFRRINRLAGRKMADASTREGHSLAQAWFGDSQTRLPVSTGARTAQNQMKRTVTGTVDMAYDNAALGAPNTQAGSFPGYHLRQNPEASPSQRWAAEFTRLNVDTSIRCEMGVALRFSISPYSGDLVRIAGRELDVLDRADSNRSGYTASVVHDLSGSPVWELQIRHFSSSQDAGYEAPIIGTASLTSLGLALGTLFKIDLEVQNFDGNVFGQGSMVALRVLVDDNIIAISPNTSVFGLSVVDSYLIDGRSIATGAGGGVGLVCIPDELGSGALVRVTSFDASDTEGDVDPPSQDQITVVIDAERAGISGELVLPVAAGVQEFSATKPIVHRMESGRIQVIAQSPRDRRAWQISATLTESEWLLVSALFDSNGSVVPFNWTHPVTDEVLDVVLVQDTLSVTTRHVSSSSTVYQLTLALEEVFGNSIYNQ